MHVENTRKGCNSVEDGERDLEGSQSAGRSREFNGEQFGPVVDRDTRVASLKNQGIILESPNSMEILPANRNDEMLAKTKQNTSFQEQLEEIDHELFKFYNVKVKGVDFDICEVMSHRQESEEKEANGPGPLGLFSSPVAVRDKGKNKEKGWVHRERIFVEPNGHYSSILSKRAYRDENVKTEETEGSKKKVAKSNLMSSAEAVPSSAGTNESFSMELPGSWELLGAWEPSCSSRTCRYCTSARSWDRVFVGNMV